MLSEADTRYCTYSIQYLLNPTLDIEHSLSIQCLLKPPLDIEHSLSIQCVLNQKLDIEHCVFSVY